MKSEVKSEVSLKRALGIFSSTLIVIGLLIGSGVFKKIVPMAQTGLSEVAILLAWVLAGTITLFGAFTVGGLATLTEESGGIYEYLQISFGKFFAFLSGWTDFMIIGPGGNAALAFLFAQIVNTVVPIGNPLQSLETISIANFIFPFADSGVKFVGVATIIILTVINCIGIKESGIFNNIVTTAKIFGIFVLIFLGVAYSSPELAIEPIATDTANTSHGLAFLSSFLLAMLSAFWAYDGWTHSCNIAGEIVNPKRNLPLAMTLGIAIVIVVYVLVNYAYMRVLPLETLRALGENEIGGTVVANTLLGEYGNILFLVLMVICVFGCLNSTIVSIPRKYFRMAEDGYFFDHVKRVHPKFRTPHVALIYSMIWSCVLLISGSFDMLTDMIIFASFILYGMLAIAVLKLKSNGTIKAKVIGYPLIPAIYLVFSVALTVNTIWAQPKQSLLGLLLILSGVPMYYLFKRKMINQRTTNEGQI
jgi:basic amino acid/polyamine antiporter, APA family